MILLLSTSISFASERDFKAVRFGVTTSVLGAGYFTGNSGLIPQVSLEGYINLIGSNTKYLYSTFQVVTSMIDPDPKYFYTGTSVNFGLGYGKWVYRDLDRYNRGWLVGLNSALLLGVYNDYFATKETNYKGWLYSLGFTANVRAVYQLNESMGFILGADITYQHSLYTLVGLENIEDGMSGGITAGIAF